VHLEGPFLSPPQAGAHDRRHLCDPDPGLVDVLLRAGEDGVLLYVTLAPERSGALGAIRRLRAGGVRVAVGHSDATHRVVTAAADAGATLVPHLYNAQSGLHHREPGVVGAALTDPRLTAGLIVDGAHVLPAAVAVALAAAPGRVMLVTDAVAAFGMAPGRYVLGGEEIVLVDGRPPRRADGTFAGAIGRLDDAIGRAAAVGVGLRTAVEAATRVPAAALGRPDLGRLAPGLTADLVWLAPQGPHPLRARATWVAGRRVHGPDVAAGTAG
jgi:N-acetylglucosamine-6-phosphate deacetylase